MCAKCTVLSKRISHVISLLSTCFGSRGSQVRILPPRLDRNKETLREIEGFLVGCYFVRFNQKGSNITYYGYTFYGYSMDTLFRKLFEVYFYH